MSLIKSDVSPVIFEAKREILIRSAAAEWVKMMRRSKKRAEPKGFTLIELLVVIAIIVILAAMLFPVLKNSQQSARAATCLANLKQIGVAMIQYSDDWKGRFPYGHNWDPGYDKIWPPYTKDPRILACPAERTPNPRGYDYIWRDGIRIEPPIKISYQYRNRLYPFEKRNADGSYVNPWQPDSPGISQVGLLWDHFTLAHMYGIGVLFGDGHAKLLQHDQLHRATPRNGWLVLSSFDSFPEGNPFKRRVVMWNDPPNWHELANYTPNP